MLLFRYFDGVITHLLTHTHTRTNAYIHIERGRREIETEIEWRIGVIKYKRHMRESEGCTYPLTNRFEADCVDMSVAFCKVIAYVPNSDNLTTKRDDSTLERKVISFCIYRLVLHTGIQWSVDPNAYACAQGTFWWTHLHLIQNHGCETPRQWNTSSRPNQISSWSTIWNELDNNCATVGAAYIRTHSNL